MKKICNHCKKLKDLNEYCFRVEIYKIGPNKGERIRKGDCKDCQVEMTREWIKKNKEKFKNYQRIYHKKYYGTTQKK